MPSFSNLLKMINSKFLDKSSLIEVNIHPSFRLSLDQKLLELILRINTLNLSYVDTMQNYYLFPTEDDYFQSKENLLYMRTKLNVQEDIRIKLVEDSEEIVEIYLRPLSQTERELIRVD